MNIITRGFAKLQQIITQGFGYFVEIIPPVGPTVYVRQEGGGGFPDDYITAVDKVIRTERIRTKGPNFKIDVNVTFIGKPPIEVLAKLKKHSSENKQINLNVTILKR